MSYIVSARKYRPARFLDVVGQDHVVQTLKNAFGTGKLAHAFLFCGPRGVGKTTCARILAKVLNCQNVTEDFEPCNECQSCQAFNQSGSFNIFELDAASNNSVDHIRALNEQVRFQPQQGKYKVYIIDEVHMLSTHAFNAFLKTLEEPPPHAIFILATTEKHKIIPTILSRCQVYDFKRISVIDMVRHLEKISELEGIHAEKEALHVIAQKSDGALRDALSIFDRILSFSDKQVTYEKVLENLNFLDYDYYFRLTDALITEDVSQVLLLFDEVLRNGFEGDTFIQGLANHIRDLLVCKDPSTIGLMEVSEQLQARYLDQASYVPTAFLLSALPIASKCDLDYREAKNKRLLTEIALLKMAYLHRAVSATSNVLHDANYTGQGAKVSPPSAENREENGEKKTPELSSAEKPRATEEIPSIKAMDTSDQEEKLPEQKPPLLPSSGKRITPTIKDLNEITREVAVEEEAENTLNMEAGESGFLEAWNKFVQTKENHVRTVLENARVHLVGNNVVIRVGSVLAENTILQELGLMDFLRKELSRPDLVREMIIDEELSPAKNAPPAPKVLSPKEKFQKMAEVNPLVKNAYEKFDLRWEDE